MVIYIYSFLFSSANLLLYKIRRKETSEHIFDKKRKSVLLLLLFIAGGVGIALNNLINLYLSGVVDSAVFFPIVNGGRLILITVASLIFFEEKLSANQWIGLCFAIAATLLLCI